MREMGALGMENTKNGHKSVLSRYLECRVPEPIGESSASFGKIDELGKREVTSRR